MRWTIRQIDETAWELRHGDEIVNTFETAAAAVAAIDEVALQIDGGGTRFNMVMCVEGVDTGPGDDRYLEVGGGTWRTPPLALMFMDETQPGHMGASLAGRIDAVQRLSDGRRIFATGVYDSGDVGTEAARLVGEQTLRCVSVDIGPAEVEMQPLAIDARDGWPERVLYRFTSFEVMGATICPFPALPLAVIWNDGDAIPEEVTAELPAPIPADQEPVFTHLDEVVPESPMDAADEIAVIIASTTFAATGLPLASRDRAWDSTAADKRLRGWADATEKPNAKYGSAFFYVDGENTDKFGGYKLPFADVVDGELTAVPRAIFACAQRLDGTQIPDADKATIRNRISSYYAAMRKEFDDPSIVPPWEKEAAVSGPGAIVASSLVIPARPPSDWFLDPAFDAPCRLTITDAGEVFGHIGEWDCCHQGFSDRCVRLPRDPENGAYSVFLNGETVCDDDTRVMTGKLVAGGTHADVRLDARAAMRHYDDCSTAVADLNIGEDRFGIWVHGALRPGVSEEALRILRASPPSGDWRPDNGKLQLLIVQGVNSEGFPVRALVSSAGDGIIDADAEPLALVASAGRHLATNRFAPHEYAPDGEGACTACGAGVAGPLHTMTSSTLEPLVLIEDDSRLAALIDAALERRLAPVIDRLDVLGRAVTPLMPIAAERIADLGVIPKVPTALEQAFQRANTSIVVLNDDTQTTFTGTDG